MAVNDDQAVVTIGARVITRGRFRQACEQQLAGLQAAHGGRVARDTLIKSGVHLQVLPGLIDEEVALVAAERLGIEVTDTQASVQIASLPAFQENGRFVGENRCRQILQAQTPPITQDEFVESLRRHMVQDKLRVSIARDTVTEAEGSAIYRTYIEQAKSTMHIVVNPERIAAVVKRVR